MPEWQNDERRCLLNHFNTSYKGVYILKTLVEVSYFLGTMIKLFV